MLDDGPTDAGELEREPPEFLRKIFWGSKRLAATSRGRLTPLRVQVFVARVRLQAAWQRCPIDIRVAPDVRIGRGTRVVFAERRPVSLHIGAGCLLEERVLFRFAGGSVHLGARVVLRGDVVLNVAGGILRMEGDDLLSWGAVVHCEESVTIRRLSAIGEYVTIADSNHYFTEPDRWCYHNTTTAPVVLGYNTWIAPKVTITKGVTVGDYAIVGANSVVTRDTPEASLVAGNPASPIRPVDLPWRA